MSVKIKRPVNLWVILSFMVLAGLSTILLTSTHSLFGTGDMPMHLHQLREVELALHHRSLVYYGLNEFHGSAIMTLYPWLNLWPMAVLADFIKNKILVIYGFFVLNEFIVLLISYFSSVSFSQSSETSYLFAVFYGLSTLYLDYGFADLDWGELLTMTFLPLVIFGSVALLRKGRWLELSTGMTLLISSHVLNTVIISFFLTVFFVINLFKFNPRILHNLFKAILLTVFTTIAVWLPAIRIMRLNPNLTTPPTAKLYGTPARQIISGALKGDVTYGVSLFALCGIILGLFYFLKMNRYLRQFYVISVLVVIMCSLGAKWWSMLPASLTELQFTWRLYLIPEVVLSYVSAGAIDRFMKRRSHRLNVWAIVGLVLIMLGFQFESQQRLINIGTNGRAPVLTSAYLKRLDRPYRPQGLNRATYLKTVFEHYPHANVKTPEKFKLAGNRSYDSLFNQQRFLKTAPQYWPAVAKLHYNDINDHRIRSARGLDGFLYNNGYNRFTFTNRRPLTKVFLPLLYYNGERMAVKLDGRKLRAGSFQHMLFVKRLPKGTHELSINIEKDQTYYVGRLTLVIGILLYITLLLKQLWYKEIR